MTNSIPSIANNVLHQNTINRNYTTMYLRELSILSDGLKKRYMVGASSARTQMCVTRVQVQK